MSGIGWRLVALNGTQFSLTNTPQVKASAHKAKSRRGQAAFAKLTTGVLLEVGLRNPLASAIGRGGQSEWGLDLELLAQLPARALLLADRLHGCAAFLAAAWAACEKAGSHFLIRARTNIKVQKVRRFKDGSRLLRVPVRQTGQPRVIAQWLELREIRVRVQRPGHRAAELRLWTSLLDPRSAPAQELIPLYARRWQHELYYRELQGHWGQTQAMRRRQEELNRWHWVCTATCFRLQHRCRKGPSKNKLRALITEQQRMNYKEARRRDEPVGSGAIESTCRHHLGLRQRRPHCQRHHAAARHGRTLATGSVRRARIFDALTIARKASPRRFTPTIRRRAG